MNIYRQDDVRTLIKGNSYVGRGIIVGKSRDGKKACTAYFIMGRSVNSRNRVFVEKGDEVVIYPFDESKVEDPSLIIYSPIRKSDNHLIVTNGNQTDTIYDALKSGGTFSGALATREFEPDGPNFTPRISAMLTFDNGDFTYESIDEAGSDCCRYTYSYPSKAGLGHFIHTYICDGNPIPTFCGEPERVNVPDDIDAFTNEIWNSLDDNNKISLYVRYIDLATGKYETRIVNKNE